MPKISILAKSILIGSSTWQLQCSNYSDVYNCVRVHNTSNVEFLRRRHQKNVRPVVTLEEDFHSCSVLLTLIYDWNHT